jgi:hypothetical protein
MKHPIRIPHRPMVTIIVPHNCECGHHMEVPCDGKTYECACGASVRASSGKFGVNVTAIAPLRDVPITVVMTVPPLPN